MYLSSDKGKRLLNFCYSWGASIVILGALFKILHVPYGNTMLSVGMITEFFVFFVFGFERPNADYRWEDVFPVLKSKNPLDRPEFTASDKAAQPNAGGSVYIGSISGAGNIEGIDITGATGGGGGGIIGNISGAGNIKGIDITGATGTTGGGGGIAGNIQGAAPSMNIPGGNSQSLSSGIQKLLDATDRIAEIPQLTEATQKYLEQLTSIAGDMERFSSITQSLSNVSDGINRSSQGYVQQMEQLNRNITGLNTIYEVQLRSISSQISSIEHINTGLNRIRELYDGSIVDSSVFRSETEKMAQQLAQLNQVYSRLLQAMTVNMGIPPVAPNPYQTR
jgi:uncharacterized protein YukE